jgi:hypothetical protein
MSVASISAVPISILLVLKEIEGKPFQKIESSNPA